MVGALPDVFLRLDHPLDVGLVLVLVDPNFLAVDVEAQQLGIQILGVDVRVIEQVLNLLADVDRGRRIAGLPASLFGLRVQCRCFVVSQGRAGRTRVQILFGCFVNLVLVLLLQLVKLLNELVLGARVVNHLSADSLQLRLYQGAWDGLQNTLPKHVLHVVAEYARVSLLGYCPLDRLLRFGMRSLCSLLDMLLVELLEEVVFAEVDASSPAKLRLLCELLLLTNPDGRS